MIIDHVLIDFRTVKMKMTEVIHSVSQFKTYYPEDEIFMDGDRYAIVRRERL